jgi:NAD(P)-dependent dehydrogenase (short-subunit alcohol dehydrogenase family)
VLLEPTVLPESAGSHPNAGRPRRFLVEDTELAPAADELPPGGQFLIADDGRGVAPELAALLERRGIRTVTATAPAVDDFTGMDGLVHLGALRPDAAPVLPGEFGIFRAALASGMRTLLVATATGGTFGRERIGDPADLGLRGLMRTIAAEYPGVLARAVDVQPKDSPLAIATQLLAELADRSGPAVTGYRGGRRVGLRVRAAGPPAAGPDKPGLDADSVVLLSGGARGITGSVALALARSAGCHIELIGRTPLPGPSDPEIEARLSGTGERAAVRRVLIERGLRDPREIEAGTALALREKEMRATLGALREAAASVRYHAVDVRDATAVSAVISDVYARHGRLDGVIHGAGVLADRLVSDKSPESFTRVYATKVDGARALTAGLREDLKFFVLFGSVAGVFGNRGQADYAAANDALDALAWHWSLDGLPVLPAADRAGQTRVVAVDWGPWAGGGMISPELEREYARRGVTLIDPGAGAACLLAEISAGDGPAQVIYMCDEAPGD